MSPGPRSSTTPVDRAPRLRMRPDAAPPASPPGADGAWWPWSTDLAEQLPVVLTELWDRLGGVERVVYDHRTWPTTAARIAVCGRLVQLVGRPSGDPDLIELYGAASGRVTTLLVVPASTNAHDAEDALSAAALPGGTTGISSRFVGAAVSGRGERWGNGGAGPNGSDRPGHEIGESHRVRAAEERHAVRERAMAARTVAGHAVDAEDCSMLLSLLGLDADGRTD